MPGPTGTITSTTGARFIPTTIVGPPKPTYMPMPTGYVEIAMPDGIELP